VTGSLHVLAALSAGKRTQEPFAYKAVRAQEQSENTWMMMMITIQFNSLF
jgi:hypothetical protein